MVRPRPKLSTLNETEKHGRKIGLGKVASLSMGTLQNKEDEKSSHCYATLLPGALVAAQLIAEFTLRSIVPIRTSRSGYDTRRTVPVGPWPCLLV